MIYLGFPNFNSTSLGGARHPGAQVVAVSASVGALLAVPGATTAALTAVERERAQRLARAADRDAFLAAHLLVRECVGRLLGRTAQSVTIVQRCPTCGGPHGRPQVLGRAEVHATLSHSHGVVAAAAGFAPLGIDVEAPASAATLVASDLAAALSPAELAAAAADPGTALLRAWVRKEAFLKAGAVVDLDGLAGFDLSSLPAVEPPPGGRARSTRVTLRGAWWVHDWATEFPPGLGALVTTASGLA